jgi:hypothetical protein
VPDVLFHFSEDPTIERFVPHVPATNPGQAPAVWAIDEEHAPLYWFPRDCPRVTAWPRAAAERPAFEAAFTTTARRVHAMEAGWLARVRSVELFRYTFAGGDFAPWADATGQWVADHAVEPVAVEPVGDLLAAHAAAPIELRVVPSLWPLHDLAVSDRWDFSIVRMRNAQPR